MKERVINIRVVFVAFCGLMVGMLFSFFNTFNNFKLWKTILFFTVVMLISSGLFLYGKLTAKRNFIIRARRKVSFLLMSSGVLFLIFTVLGFVIILAPYLKIINIKSYDTPVRLEGVVSDYVSDNSTYKKFILDDCFIESNGDVEKNNFKICVYSDNYTDVSLGDRIIIEDCTLNNFKISKYTDLIKLCQGIAYQTYINVSDVDINSGEPILRDKIKNKTYNILSDNLNEDNANIIYAMIFGEKLALSENISDSFSYAGISHVLAVSGLHVGILATAILFILKKIKMNKYLRIILLSIVLFFYAYLCSYSPSVCRAGIMTILLSLCDAMQVEYDGLSSLSIAGIIILLFSPLSIMSLSFQLSFLSVFGIISFSPTLNKLFNKIKIPKSLASVFAISICTNLAILPVCANAFTKVSLLGIFTNFFVIPLFTVNYILAFFIVLLSFIFAGLGKLLVLPNLFLHLIKFIAELSTKVDGLVYKTFQNSYIILFLFCSAILLLHYLMSKKLVKFSIILPLIMLSVVQFSVANIEYKAIDNTLIFTHQYKSNIVFYIKDNEVTMIGSNIDCDSLLYTMKNLKIRDIDNLVAYDMQLNNMKNLKEIIYEFDVENLYIPNKFEYSEISSTFNNEIFYENNIEIKDLSLESIDFENQTIGIYLNISEIGDILIPEIKPTKPEGNMLCESFVGVKYYYQPEITKNMHMDILKPKCIITNNDVGDLSLGDLNNVYLDKEFSYNEV